MLTGLDLVEVTVLVVGAIVYAMFLSYQDEDLEDIVIDVSKLVLLYFAVRTILSYLTSLRF